MIKELKYLFFLFIITLFFFLSFKYYFSEINKKNSYRSFKLIDEYQTQDERYPTLTQSILVFKKQENYKGDFTEELLKNYQNVKILYENQDIFSKFLLNQFRLFSIE